MFLGIRRGCRESRRELSGETSYDECAGRPVYERSEEFSGIVAELEATCRWYIPRRGIDGAPDGNNRSIVKIRRRELLANATAINVVLDHREIRAANVTTLPRLIADPEKLRDSCGKTRGSWERPTTRAGFSEPPWITETRDGRSRKYLVIIVGGSTTGHYTAFTFIAVRDGGTTGQGAQRFHSSVWVSNAIVHGGASD